MNCLKCHKETKCKAAMLGALECCHCRVQVASFKCGVCWQEQSIEGLPDSLKELYE